ncbi:hypothetical protein EC973_001415 [Apophysomyces ossiformis]|uniref:Uncharacterized protein n=1 Tax=Apophysomyces ossiformis TaxID=679940 RepID=A0A8H7BPF4_9FUNG|nr:hypothetical protein EC973_001415 [Apophysomyces ossiformis]
MVLIVSLVGGVGAVAIIAATVVLARMRIKKRKEKQESIEMRTEQTPSNHEPSIEPPPALPTESHNESHNEPEHFQNFPAVPELIYQEAGPSPSAPSAKELYAPDMVPALIPAGPSTIPKHVGDTPEIPPPAYTPSAPPLYALPVQPQPRSSNSSGLQRSSSF